VIRFINGIDYQVIIMTIEIYLVDATHCLLSMVTTAYRIAVAGKGFMKKLPRHIPEGKHHKEKYGDQFFYGP
jgi:hypothetical protein